MTRTCSMAGCTGKHYGKGYCQKHYTRVRRYGNTNAVDRPRRTFPDVAVRISSRSVPDGGCLIYTKGHASRSGHVAIGRNGRFVGVHRAAWEAANGPVPAGLFVLHKCDRPRCVNVDHLFLGTIGDNNADRDRKGRHKSLKGSANGFAKLTENQVALIKARLAQGESTYTLAAEFEISQSTVWLISAGRTWKHVSPLADLPKTHTRALAGVTWPERTDQ